MKLSEIRRIGVLGAGTMGHGIAQVFASRCYEVTLFDLVPEALPKAIERIRRNLQQLQRKGLVSSHGIQETLSFIETTTDLSRAVRDAQFVVEAVPEDPALKRDIFGKVETLCPEQSILASNTSTIRIADIACAARKPERIIGVHWMLAPHIRPLVEIIPAEKTSGETVEVTRGLIEKLDKIPIVAPDTPGFIVNRLQLGVFAQALKLLEQGVSMEDIDKAWTHHLGPRYCFTGPCEAMDSMGLDTLYLACLYLVSALDEPGLAPPEIVKKKVEAGEFGYKTGKGFYDYSGVSIDTRIDERNDQLIHLLEHLKIRVG
ncbi:MAG: 3-hydroxyacyl-CoA dehydrogenase family protein [bacterium]